MLRKLERMQHQRTLKWLRKWSTIGNNSFFVGTNFCKTLKNKTKNVLLWLKKSYKDTEKILIFERLTFIIAKQLFVWLISGLNAGL